MVDILLINAPITLYYDKEDRKNNFYSGGDEFSFYPINLLYLGAAIIDAGFTVKVIDPTAYGLNLDDIMKIIKEDTPRFIGMTAMTPGIQSAVKLAQEIKKLNIPIIIGGIHISNDPDFYNRFPLFDWAVVGDGEVEIVKILKGERQKGIIYSEPIIDLDSLSFPRRDLIDINKYRRPEQSADEHFYIDILTSRGCVYNCTFCSIYNSGKKVRFRSAKNIVDEMEYTYNICQGHYSFNDDCFTLKKQHVLDLAEEVTKRGLKCHIMAATRANCLDDEMMVALKQIGITDLSFGIESGSERIRGIIGKHLKDADIVCAVKLCKKYKIRAVFYLMAGFPTETKADMKKTIDLGPRLKIDYIGIRQTTPYPDSKIYQQSIKEGKIPADLVDQWASGKRGRDMRNAWIFYVPDGFTQKDMIAYKRAVYLRFYFDPGWIMRKIKDWIKEPRRLYDDLKLFKLLPSILKKGGTEGQYS